MATVAYEPDHSGACEDSCSCGGLAGYVAVVKNDLKTLGSPDPDADVAAQREYVVRARATGLPPAVAANLVYALQRGFSAGMLREPANANDRIVRDVTDALWRDKALAGMHVSLSVYSTDPIDWSLDVAAGPERDPSLEQRRKVPKFDSYTEAETFARQLLADRTRFTRFRLNEPAYASDYVAVDSSGKTVFGPTRDYQEAKLHADRVHGLVHFHFAAREAGAASPAFSVRAAECHVAFAGSEEDAKHAAAVADTQSAPPSSAAGERVSYADRQKLPRSAFAIPERRALLLTDKHGNPDEGHVKAAAARLSMMRREHHVNRNEHAEAMRRIHAAGKKAGIDVAEPYGECPAWYIESEPVYVGRWERGQAETDGAGKAVLARRKPDRRHGVAPWAVHVGGVEVASGETKAEAKRKFERCVKAVKARGEAANPWAICHAAINKSGAAEVAIVERTPDAAPGGKRCASPKDLHRLFGERYGRMGQEVFEVVLVNINDEMIGSPVQVAMGQASGVAVEVEQVMAVVIAGRAQAATGFFALHNHPGGTLQASPQDRDLTRRIEAARKIACPNVRFLGHIILTAKGWAKV